MAAVTSCENTLYRNDLVQNYFELTESSSYRGFQSVTEGKITVNV